MLQFLPQFPEVTSVLSEKGDGGMRARSVRVDSAVMKNRQCFYDQADIVLDKVVSGILTHSDHVAYVSKASSQFLPDTDALVTDVQGIFLAVTVADCLPVFFYDPVARVVGLAHAGWKGVVGEIASKTVEAMMVCGAQAGDIRVTIGPHICNEHFEFGKEEFFVQFGKYSSSTNFHKYFTNNTNANEASEELSEFPITNYQFPIKAKKKICVDLARIVKDQLGGVGVLSENVSVSELCTMEDERLLSARAQGENFKAMIAVIGMRK